MYRKCVCVAALCLAMAMAGSAGAQNVLFEYWFGGSINNDLDTLKADARFPDSPDQDELRAGMDRPDWGEKDYWGARARAYLTPVETGDYTFWIASDDDSELWLSTDADAANAAKICSVEGWCNYQNWTGSGESPGANRQSAPVSLVAGEKYYIEMLFSDGTGGGHGSVGWAGPGLGTTPTVLTGSVLTPFVRYQARNPVPADGGVDVTTPIFTWVGGDTSTAYNVYVGVSADLTEADLQYGSWPQKMIYYVPPLVPGATYYWRVDGIDAQGGIVTGKVWSFTVQPMTAHAPSPYDGAKWRSLTLTASWTAGQTAVSHVIYAGTDEALVAAGDASTKLAEIAETSFDATGLLEANTTYYWRIDEVDGSGTVYPGEVWSFSTIDPAGAILAEYWDNMTLSGEPKVVTTVPEINFNWSDISSPDPAIPIDGFSCRWTAQLNVPVTGTYKLYTASDDGARLFLNGVQITNGWWDRGTTEDASADLELVAGGRYVLVMEMYENGGGATAYLRWSGPGFAKEIIPQGALTPVKPLVVFVSFHGADDAPSAGAVGVGFTEAADIGYTDLLKEAGYDVKRYIQTGTPDVDMVNAADLVIVGRSVASSSFQNAAATTWNGVTAPMIVLNGYTARKNRMGFYTGSNIPDITGDIKLAVADPAHPIFAGISLTDGIMDNPYAGLAVYPTDGTTAAGISVVTDPIGADGTVLATLAAASGSVTAGSVIIAEWPAGATLTHDGGAGTDTLLAPRLLFLTGSRENGGKSSETAGMFDLYEDGATMFLNAVDYMINPPAVEEPETVVFFEDFESYVAGSDLHGQGGWKGWQGDAAAGSPASNARAFAGANSVEIIGSADLVHEFPCNGGVVTLTAMQYIPSGTAGTTYFILMNQYDDPGTALDWSVQTNFDLAAGVVNFDGGATAAIVYDKWVELKCVIDLDNNSVQLYYDGVAYATNQWDNDGHTTFQAIDLYGNNASSVWYDDIKIVQ